MRPIRPNVGPLHGILTLGTIASDGIHVAAGCRRRSCVSDASEAHMLDDAEPVPDDRTSALVGPGQRPILIRLAAYGLIRRDASVLLCRIAEGYGDAGAWTLPGGGVEFGETPEAAAVREIREETGLEVELTAAPQILTDSGMSTTRGAARRYHQVRFVYPVRVVGGEERVEVGNSTAGFAWLGPSDLATERLVDLVRLALALPPPE